MSFFMIQVTVFHVDILQYIIYTEIREGYLFSLIIKVKQRYLSVSFMT